MNIFEIYKKKNHESVKIDSNFRDFSFGFERYRKTAALGSTAKNEITFTIKLLVASLNMHN